MEESKCYFDISIDGKDCGRIVFKLFTTECPKTCENFKCLCTGERGISKQTNKPLHYKGTTFHRIVRDFIIQGGDITDGNGKGGDSIYDGSFEDENFTIAHDKPFLLSMANRGPSTNKSQFFITMNEAPHLDGKHVVFGRVVSGFDVVFRIERLEVDSKSKPMKAVVIKDCGEYTTEIEKAESARKESSGNLLPDERYSRGRKRQLSSSASSSSVSRSSRASSSSSSGSSSSNSSSSSSSSSNVSSRSNSRTSSCSAYSRSSSHSSRRDNKQSGPSHGYRRSSATRRSPSYDSRHSYSSSSSAERSRKRRRTNLRLEKDNRASERVSRRHKDEPVAVPGYKCSVNLDEIPEVPVNRFLMRVAPDELKDSARDSRRKNRRSRLNSDEKDEGRSSRSPVRRRSKESAPNNVDESASTEAPSSNPEQLITDALNAGRDLEASVFKPTPPIISKSGRIMRGRGTFKFRTPSPPVNKGNSGDHRRHDYRRRSPPRTSSYQNSTQRYSYKRNPNRYSSKSSRRDNVSSDSDDESPDHRDRSPIQKSLSERDTSR